jgi:hypothetical protein
MRRNRRFTVQRSAILGSIAAISLLSALPGALPATARGAFDGNWSVLVVTQHGGCDQAYRYAIHIVNGRVTYDDSSFNVSGSVDANGRVRVNISAGGQGASGSGQLSGNSGQGQWRGQSSNSGCSGYWQAERRG